MSFLPLAVHPRMDLYHVSNACRSLRLSGRSSLLIVSVFLLSVVRCLRV